MMIRRIPRKVTGVVVTVGVGLPMGTALAVTDPVPVRHIDRPAVQAAPKHRNPENFTRANPFGTPGANSHHKNFDDPGSNNSFRTEDVYAPDGSANNAEHSSWGAAGIELLRTAANNYADKVSTPAGASRPSARAVSNALSAQESSAANDRNMSDFVYVWGQFLDHDIALSPMGTQPFSISVPIGDAWFDPTRTGLKTIGMTRSAIANGTGTSASNARQQTNAVTAFIDGSQVYGSDKTRADALRTFKSGLLKTSIGNLLPLNTNGLPNANDSHALPDNRLFLAGDIRANENPDLISLQTIFLREHNRIAQANALAHPSWTDEQLYQSARRVVIAEIQAITYNEFLPALIGANALKPYSGYRSDINPSITNEFSTGAFRFGHSLLDSEISRLNNDGSQAGPAISLSHSFFNNSYFDASLPSHIGDIDPFLKAAASGNAQEVDLKIINDVRNFLFGEPGQGGFDLASLNIQRGRDHGLADYNTTRAAYGLKKFTMFSQITPDKVVQVKLADLYRTVDDIDLWVGCLAEAHVAGASVGALTQAIILDQFNRLRAGDRLWFENAFPRSQASQLADTHLSDVITRNTSLTNLQRNVFFWKG
jgi:peroxidase